MKNSKKPLLTFLIFQIGDYPGTSVLTFLDTIDGISFGYVSEPGSLRFFPFF